MKRTLLTFTQLSVTATVLWLVFHDPAKRSDMLTALTRADPTWLFIGFVVCGTVECIAGLRWRLLLQVQGIHLPWRRVFSLLMIGVFFNFFVPGGTGGDMIKIFYLMKETPGRKADAFLSVVVDRMIGLFSLIALGGFFLSSRWDWLTGTPETAAYVWPVLVILTVSSILIVGSFVLSGGELIHRLPARLPGRAKLIEFALAYHLYKRAWRPTLAAFLMSVVAHFLYFAIFWSAAKAVQFGATRVPTFAELCAIMPIVNTITAMPISLGGLGVREGLFQVFLSNLAGVTEAVSVVISSTGYLITLGWGLIGGLLYVFHRPAEHTSLRKISSDVAALEHQVAEKKPVLESLSQKDSP